MFANDVCSLVVKPVFRSGEPTEGDGDLCWMVLIGGYSSCPKTSAMFAVFSPVGIGLGWVAGSKAWVLCDCVPYGARGF